MNLPCCWVVNSKSQLHKIMLPIVKPHGDVPVVCPSDAPYFFAEHIHMLPLIWLMVTNDSYAAQRFL
jgi:hypothetical protein